MKRKRVASHSQHSDSACLRCFARRSETGTRSVTRTDSGGALVGRLTEPCGPAQAGSAMSRLSPSLVCPRSRLPIRLPLRPPLQQSEYPEWRTAHRSDDQNPLQGAETALPSPPPGAAQAQLESSSGMGANLKCGEPECGKRMGDSSTKTSSTSRGGSTPAVQHTCPSLKSRKHWGCL